MLSLGVASTVKNPSPAEVGADEPSGQYTPMPPQAFCVPVDAPPVQK